MALLSLIKRTFAIERLPFTFFKSELRDRFTEDLYALGAYKVKRVGDSYHQRLFVTFFEDNRSDDDLWEEIKSVMKNHCLEENGTLDF